MKKDRNCGATPYPVYPPYPQMNNMMPFPYPPTMGMPMTPYMGTSNNSSSTNMSTNTIEQQINNLEQRVNMLDSRITTLENMYNTSNNSLYSNNYNSSNYQML